MKSKYSSTWLAAALMAVIAGRSMAGDAPPPAPTSPAPPPVVSEEMDRKLADARQRLEAAAREVAELSGQLGRRFAFRLGMGPGEEGGAMGGPAGPARSLLGVRIGLDSGQGGARVLGVSPGGAAAEAGIKEGDVIVSIAGDDLSKDSRPGEALVEKMQQLDPNLKVQVGVMRDGKRMTMDVTPRPAPRIERRVFRGEPNGGPRWEGGPPMPPLPGLRGGDGEVRNFILRRGDGDSSATRFAGLEFATLSERLGSYFGVKSGVLVVRSGVNSPYKLQDGDVILNVGGREVTSAQHAGRILRSYQTGEKIAIRVQRDRKAVTLDVAAPAPNGPMGD
jgi:membrane-associated protease RseP (regulator of RpoE activity)